MLFGTFLKERMFSGQASGFLACSGGKKCAVPRGLYSLKELVRYDGNMQVGGNPLALLFKQTKRCSGKRKCKFTYNVPKQVLLEPRMVGVTEVATHTLSRLM
eukprot:Hpha_TRINITY_DN36007_c0_g1::TRINITY_DN36007_c0_g1_i1::g.170771::m.170771